VHLALASLALESTGKSTFARTGGDTYSKLDVEIEQGSQCPSSLNTSQKVAEAAQALRISGVALLQAVQSIVVIRQTRPTCFAACFP
jgi:hypothetical protein